MIIINSVAIMDDFDKAGAIYSDRPVLQMGGELIGFNEILVLLRNGPRFRTYRKHFSRYFGSGKPIQDLQPILEQETCRFLLRVAANGETLDQQLRTYGTISPKTRTPL
jgi:cytochrome P450